MYHHPGRLVDDEHIIVLVYYVKRNVLRKNLHPAPAIRHHEADDIARAYYEVGLDDLVAHVHISGLEGLLHAAAGGVLHVGRHVAVDAHGGLPLVHLKPEMFEKLLFHHFFLR